MTGLATMSGVKKIIPEARKVTPAREVACARDEVPTARPDQPLVELLEKMHGCAEGRALVLRDGYSPVSSRPATSAASSSRQACGRGVRFQPPDRP